VRKGAIDRENTESKADACALPPSASPRNSEMTRSASKHHNTTTQVHRGYEMARTLGMPIATHSSRHCQVPVS
jgi:hypothetical protein